MIETTAKEYETEDFDLEVVTTDKIWRAIIAKDKSGAAAALKSEISCTPGILKLQSFMAYFDTN